MKQYPKVARHDLPFVPDALFEADDLHLLEKMDGGNFRFMLYEDRFADEYDEVVHEQNPSDGDIVFGTKRVVRGCVSDSVETFDSDFELAVATLRDIPTDPIRRAQDEHGPLVWFAEYMIPHTLDYEYGQSPPPALIGFDVYAQRKDSRQSADFPANPYKERHVGYLPLGEARRLFKQINIPFTPVVKTPADIDGMFDPSEYEVPQSEYGPMQAEGVVLRSDTLNVRAKYVTESFRELHKTSMGGQPSDADDPVQWVVDALITPARIRKHARRLVREEGYEFTTDDSFVGEVAQTVLADAWSEEFAEISELDSPFAPAETHDSAEERVRHVLERMEQMAARTDEDPTAAWTSIDGEPVNDHPPSGHDAASSVETDMNRLVRNEALSPERALFDEFVGGTEAVDTTLDTLIEERDRQLAGWAVVPAVERLSDKFWASDRSRGTLWQLDVEFTPSEVERTIRALVRERIEARADVDLDAGGASWDPTEEEAETEGFGNLF